MTYRVAINGFGRIGRVVVRILEQRRRQKTSNAQLVAINDLANIDDLAYLLTYDSVHKKFDGEVAYEKDRLLVNNQPISCFAVRDPQELPWRDLNIDVVLEATGHFLTRDKASRHLNAGAKRVLLSAPAKDPDATICYGVNTHDFKNNMNIISTASCTTNCIAPIASIMHEKLGIKKASVTTIHSYTNDQRLLDLHHEDKRRSRAAALSLIPTTTGAAQAVALVLPALKGRFQGLAIRVPTPNVSLIDMVCQVEKNTSVKEVNELLLEATHERFKNIMAYCDEPLVSIDMNGSNYSSIVDAGCTQVVDGDLVKVMAWYDNEWGFANRAVDLIELLGTSN
jgi:glyceraldehyde 3-phosphate dehydrogenase